MGSIKEEKEVHWKKKTTLQNSAIWRIVSVREVQTVEATQPEPNLIDIKKMLVDIQATVTMILKETKN